MNVPHTDINLIALVDKVKAMRKDRKWSQTYLADMMNVKKQYIQQFEQYKICIGYIPLCKMAAAFETTPSELIKTGFNSTIYINLKN